MEIYLIRHGQSKSNNDGTIQGQFDSPLSDLGIHQARLIREYLPKDYDMVYSSPLQRARDTALIALKIQIDHPKLEIVDNLKEIGLGELEGIHSSTLDFSKDQFREHAYLREDLFNGKFGAEKLVDFKSRAAEVFNKILKNSQNKKFNRILIFSHGGIMRAILNYYLNLTAETIYNTDIIKLSKSNGSWKYIQLNHNNIPQSIESSNE